MKSTLKITLLATALMAAQPVLAKDINHKTMHQRGEYYNSQSPAASLDAADRMNGSDSRMNHTSSDRSWMGMGYTTRGMKDGVDSDMNNRSQHAFIFGNNASHVTKH